MQLKHAPFISKGSYKAAESPAQVSPLAINQGNKPQNYPSASEGMWEQPQGPQVWEG